MLGQARSCSRGELEAYVQRTVQLSGRFPPRQKLLQQNSLPFPIGSGLKMSSAGAVAQVAKQTHCVVPRQGNQDVTPLEEAPNGNFSYSIAVFVVGMHKVRHTAKFRA